MSLFLPLRMGSGSVFRSSRHGPWVASHVYVSRSPQRSGNDGLSFHASDFANACLSSQVVSPKYCDEIDLVKKSTSKKGGEFWHLVLFVMVWVLAPFPIGPLSLTLLFWWKGELNVLEGIFIKNNNNNTCQKRLFYISVGWRSERGISPCLGSCTRWIFNFRVLGIWIPTSLHMHARTHTHRKTQAPGRLLRSCTKWFVSHPQFDLSFRS